MTIQTVRALYAAGLGKDAVDQLLALDTAAATAQTTANNAANSSASVKITPNGTVWSSDTAGVFTAGNPTQDIVFTFYDKDDVSIAVATHRGTLTSSTGIVTVSPVSQSGLVTTAAYIDNASTSVLAEVTVTLADGSMFTASTAWSSVDISAAATTPVTGGGK